MSKKSYTFREVLENEEGKKLIEALEHGSSDPELEQYWVDQLKEKFNYTYIR